jgi:hypothetical protein
MRDKGLAVNVTRGEEGWMGSFSAIKIKEFSSFAGSKI